MESQSIDWTQLNSKLPVTTQPEDIEKRQKLYRGFDGNGNGYLSLAQVDKGIRDFLEIPEIFDCKQPIMRAFQAAKGQFKSNKYGDDYIELKEFKFFLIYLRQYFEYWVMFDTIDTSDDKRIDLDEFKKAVPTLERWGVQITDPAATFKGIDTNGGGFILFDEFSEWAIQKSLDLDDDVDLE